MEVTPDKKGAFLPAVTQSAEILYHARSAAIPAGAPDIQIFPPGRQTITPSSPDPAKTPQAMELTIGSTTAATLEAARAAHQAKADAGEGDSPFFDFNHDDREAAAWPKRIFWAGDDPLLGGVRAEVEWTSAGTEAVTGKLFRRFSPAFFAKDGEITGAPCNMGGLVNRAAFTAIAPLFAKTADTQSSTTTPNMTPEEIAALQQENADLKTTIASLQAQIDDMSVTAKAAAETAAKETVACAARDGRIPPAAEIQAKWTAAIVADPANAELLLAMAPNAALLTVIRAKAAPDAPAKDDTPAKTGLDAVAEIIATRRCATASN